MTKLSDPVLPRYEAARGEYNEIHQSENAPRN